MKSLMSFIDVIIRSIILVSYLFTFTFILIIINAILKIVTFERLFNKGVRDA
jgi:hypothetical protein